MKRRIDHEHPSDDDMGFAFNQEKAGEISRPEGNSRVKLKLTAEQVAQIRQQHQYGRRPSVIAKEFGISVQYVWLIVRGLNRK